jgi:hypothetical protein
MNDQDKNKFKEILTMISENDNQIFSQTKIKLWWEIFKEYSVEDFSAAVFKNIKDPESGKYPTKIAHITANLTCGERSQEDRATVAWMQIEAAIRRVGAYGDLELEDKQALVAVKNMCSWQELCHTNVDKLAFRRNEFIANYKALENTDVKYLEKLEGIESLENQRVGLSDIAKLVDDR